jgi:endonuclease YncB( thermonuclease family)
MAKPKKQLWKRWLAALAAGSIIGGGWLASRGELVTEVIDGDSFKISNKQTIRLASLNAPAKELCYGKEATQALTGKILNKRVVLNDLRTDRYGRIIAQVYVNGMHLNNFMVKNGFAESTRQAGGETAQIKIANEYARENKIGIFSSGCFQEIPPDQKCAIKGNVNDRAANEKYYFTLNCRHYSKVIVKKSFGDSWFCTEQEAQKAGFTKAPNCN